MDDPFNRVAGLDGQLPDATLQMEQGRVAHG